MNLGWGIAPWHFNLSTRDQWLLQPDRSLGSFSVSMILYYHRSFERSRASNLEARLCIFYQDISSWC